MARSLCFTRVCDSVHGGGGVCYPSMYCRWYPSMPCSRGVPAPGGLLRGGVCSRGSLLPGWGFRNPPPPQADGYCCGRYASYWNAFLLFNSMPTSNNKSMNSTSLTPTHPLTMNYPRIVCDSFRVHDLLNVTDSMKWTGQGDYHYTYVNIDSSGRIESRLMFEYLSNNEARSLNFIRKNT